MGFDSVTFYVDGTILRIDDEWPYSAIFLLSRKETIRLRSWQKMTLTTKPYLLLTLFRLPWADPSGGANPVVRGKWIQLHPKRRNYWFRIDCIGKFEDFDDGISRVEFTSCSWNQRSLCLATISNLSLMLHLPYSWVGGSCHWIDH